MRVAIGTVIRCQPRIWIRRLEDLVGTGTATVAEVTPNRPFQSPEDAGWTEIERSDLERVARAGYDIYVKTASYGGRCRVYRRLQVGPVPGTAPESRLPQR